MDPLAEIRRLYYRTTAATIQGDLARAIELLKSLKTEPERERAAVCIWMGCRRCGRSGPLGERPSVMVVAMARPLNMVNIVNMVNRVSWVDIVSIEAMAVENRDPF